MKSNPKPSAVKSGMEKITKICIILTLIAIFIVLGLLFGGKTKSQQGTIQGRTMGTTYHIKYWYTDLKNGPEKTVLQQDINTVLQTINDTVSTWNKNSTISKFNQSNSTEWTPVKPFFATMVAQAVSVCQATYGAFDITVAPLIDIWGFDAKGRIETKPKTEVLANALNKIGCDLVQADTEKSQIRKTDSAVQINLSAIAKGDGVDQVAGVLKSYGIGNYMVEIGGEIVTAGTRKDGKKWRIGIEQPTFDNRSVQQIVSLYNIGMATSGDYRNYFEENGIRYSHIINPQTGMPISHKLASVTVLADTSRSADVWATAFFVLGEGRAYQLANKQKLPILMILRNDNTADTPYTVITNPYWDTYVEQNP